MGERKGQNKYYPPDFDPKKHGSLAGYHGQHSLRERARKMHLGILIIRFEMPYNIWCDGCGNHVGMGVRYNAEKSKIGMYYSTPIYKFRMKCHLCVNHIEMKTDPANHDYVIISGARRKEQRWDPKENEQIVPEDRESQKKLALDAMYRLEHGVEDQSKIKAAMPGIRQLEEMQSRWEDDYILNKIARQKFRDEKSVMKSAKEKDDELLTKSSLDISLVKEHADDVKLAGLLRYRSAQSYDDKEKEKLVAINEQSIFSRSPLGSDLSANSTPLSAVGKTRKEIGLSKAKQKIVLLSKKNLPNPFASQSMIIARKGTALEKSVCRKDSVANTSVITAMDNPSNKNAMGHSELVTECDSEDFGIVSTEPLKQDTMGEKSSRIENSLVANYDSSSNSSCDQ